MRWAFAAGGLVAATDLAGALEPAAAAFEAWEITGEGPWRTAEGLAAMARVLPSFRFRITFHASWRDVDLAAPDDAARARHVALVRAQLGAARSLGAEAVVVHPGSRIRALADPGALVRCRASLATLAAAARDLGFELRVENMPRGPTELAQSAEELRDLVAPTTGAACWDLGHARTTQADPRAVAPFLREVHAHDNDGRGDAHQPLTPRSAWFAPALRALPEVAHVTFEHKTVAECLASLEEAKRLLAASGGNGGV